MCILKPGAEFISGVSSESRIALFRRTGWPWLTLSVFPIDWDCYDFRSLPNTPDTISVSPRTQAAGLVDYLPGFSAKVSRHIPGRSGSTSRPCGTRVMTWMPDTPQPSSRTGVV